MTTVLLDNGHGFDTAGKRSPGGELREWEWTRRLTSLIAFGLEAEGIACRRIVPESIDVPLAERVKRVNAWPGSKLLLSVHANAAGMGDEWLNASGWSAFVARQASAEARLLARLLAEAAEAEGLKVRRPQPSRDYWEAGFAMLTRTACPAVLTENLFMDNRSDLAFMLSPQGMDALAALHVEGVKRYLLQR